MSVLGNVASQAREGRRGLLWKSKPQKLEKSDARREIVTGLQPSPWLHPPTMHASGLLESEKSVLPHTPSLPSPESPHSREPGWSSEILQGLLGMTSPVSMAVVPVVWLLEWNMPG